MIELLPAAAHVAAFHLHGTLTGDDYDLCIAEIEARLTHHRRIGLYCDLSGFTGLTAEALGKDLRYALGKLGEYPRFARGAIVTDKRWLAVATDFAGKFFPRTEIRSFESRERDAALAWATDIEPAGS